MYKVKQFGSGSEPAGCLSKQQLSNQARFKAATAKKIHLQDPLDIFHVCVHLYTKSSWLVPKKEHMYVFFALPLCVCILKKK